MSEFTRHFAPVVVFVLGTALITASVSCLFLGAGEALSFFEKLEEVRCLRWSRVHLVDRLRDRESLLPEIFLRNRLPQGLLSSARKRRRRLDGDEADRAHGKFIIVQIRPGLTSGHLRKKNIGRRAAYAKPAQVVLVDETAGDSSARRRVKRRLTVGNASTPLLLCGGRVLHHEFRL